MSKLKYEVLLPKSSAQLEGMFSGLLKTKSKHLIIKIIDKYITPDTLKEILDKYQNHIENYKKNKSIVILYDNYDNIPDFMPVAPTEEEALDIIEFEEIERDLWLNE